jgi:hypothetical protein
MGRKTEQFPDYFFAQEHLSPTGMHRVNLPVDDK